MTHDGPPIHRTGGAGAPSDDGRNAIEIDAASEADVALVLARAVAGLRRCGPCPLLVLSGKQDSARSSFAAILKALLDPDSAPLRALPREDRDLFIAAANGHLPAFDNLSGVPAWISDTPCRLASSHGSDLRQLYADQDEVPFDACRLMILNGIEDVVTRPDRADRANMLTLEAARCRARSRMIVPQR